MLYFRFRQVTSYIFPLTSSIFRLPGCIFVQGPPRTCGRDRGRCGFYRTYYDCFLFGFIRFAHLFCFTQKAQKARKFYSLRSWLGHTDCTDITDFCFAALSIYSLRSFSCHTESTERRPAALGALRARSVGVTTQRGRHGCRFGVIAA